jgi:hypothetical protein
MCFHLFQLTPQSRIYVLKADSRLFTQQIPRLFHNPKTNVLVHTQKICLRTILIFYWYIRSDTSSIVVPSGFNLGSVGPNSILVTKSNFLRDLAVIS